MMWCGMVLWAVRDKGAVSYGTGFRALVCEALPGRKTGGGLVVQVA